MLLKFSSTLSLLVIFVAGVFAQTTTISILDEHFTLNSGSYMGTGGVTRQSRKITLPPGTEYWYYRIAIDNGTSPPSFGEAAKLVGILNPSMALVAATLADGLGNYSSQDCKSEFFFTDLKNARIFENGAGSGITDYNSYQDQNFKNVRRKYSIEKWAINADPIFICFRNHNMRTAISVRIEVYAVVRTHQ